MKLNLMTYRSCKRMLILGGCLLSAHAGSLAQAGGERYYKLYSKDNTPSEKQNGRVEGRVYAYTPADSKTVLITAKIGPNGLVEYSIPDTLVVDALLAFKLKYRIYPSEDMKLLYVKPVASGKVRKLSVKDDLGFTASYSAGEQYYKLPLRRKQEGYRVWISDEDGIVYYNFQQ